MMGRPGCEMVAESNLGFKPIGCPSMLLSDAASWPRAGANAECAFGQYVLRQSADIHQHEWRTASMAIATSGLATARSVLLYS